MESNLAAEITNYLLVSIFFLLYFTPAIIAFFRNHYNKVPIIIVDIFLGWTFIAWVICLAWSFSRAKKYKLAKNQFVHE